MIRNPMQMIQQFNQFKAHFRGDPQAEVQKLVAQGKMSQQQLNRLQAMANEFQDIMTKYR